MYITFHSSPFYHLCTHGQEKFPSSLSPCTAVIDHTPNIARSENVPAEDKQLPTTSLQPEMASLRFLFFGFMSLITAVRAGRVLPHTFMNQVRNFPNIQRDHSKCLTEAQRGTASSIYVCDRNGLLTPEEVKILHNMLKDIRQTLNSDARPCDRRRPRPTIAIAVIQKMQIENDATQEMILNYASVFAYHLFDSWKLNSRCESSKIIIFFSRDDGVLYTYAGEQMKEVLPTKKILSIALLSKQAFADGIKNGMMFILDQYKLRCEGSKRDV